MLTYHELKLNRQKFLSLTGLTVSEFELLLPAFAQSYDRLFPVGQTLDGRPRKRSAGGGRTGSLHLAEQKLLFMLVYFKTYPLQVILGELFGLSQSQTNHWIHHLLPVLRTALDELGVLPERDPACFAQHRDIEEKDPQLIIDGTERRRQRPKNPAKQAAHYSGKKKTHSDKNVVILDIRTERIEFLSHTYAGRTHDKKIADQEQIR